MCVCVCVCVRVCVYVPDFCQVELRLLAHLSSDPELQKVLNVARLLGRTAPAPPKVVKRVPMFNLLPTQIR